MIWILQRSMLNRNNARLGISLLQWLLLISTIRPWEILWEYCICHCFLKSCANVSCNDHKWIFEIQSICMLSIAYGMSEFQEMMLDDYTWIINYFDSIKKRNIMPMLFIQRHIVTKSKLLWNMLLLSKPNLYVENTFTCLHLWC